MIPKFQDFLHSFVEGLRLGAVGTSSGGAPTFPQEQRSQAKVLLMGFISGSLRAFQTKLAKDEACCKAAREAGKSPEQPGVDYRPSLTCSLAAVPSSLATASLEAGPETYSSQPKQRGPYYKDRAWLTESKDRLLGTRKPPKWRQLSSVSLGRLHIIFSAYLYNLVLQFSFPVAPRVCPS